MDSQEYFKVLIKKIQDDIEAMQNRLLAIRIELENATEMIREEKFND